MQDKTRSSTLHNLIKIGQAAKILGVSIDSLRRWERSGKLTSIKTPGGTRFYSLNQLGNHNPLINTGLTKRAPVVHGLQINKLATLSISLLITVLTATFAVMAVYLAIPSSEEVLSRANVKTSVRAFEVLAMDNTHLNKTAALLKNETNDLVGDPETDLGNNSLTSNTYLTGDVNNSWSITYEDCVDSIIDRNI